MVMVGLMLSCYLVGRLKFNIYNCLCCGAKANTSFIKTGFKNGCFTVLVSPLSTHQGRQGEEATERPPQGYDNRMRSPWNCKDLSDHFIHRSALMHKPQGLSDVRLGIIQFFSTAVQTYPSPPHSQTFWCFLFLWTCLHLL